MVDKEREPRPRIGDTKPDKPSTVVADDPHFASATPVASMSKCVPHKLVKDSSKARNGFVAYTQANELLAQRARENVGKILLIAAKLGSNALNLLGPSLA